jgi:methyl-accepting chemotaxis protein
MGIEPYFVLLSFMSFFDQDFYNARKKSWIFLENHFETLINKTFDVLKNDPNLNKHFPDLFKDEYQESYLKHNKNLFTMPLDDIQKEGSKRNAEFYLSHGVSPSLYIQHQYTLQKILKVFIREKYWYNLLHVIKYGDIIDSIIEFDIKAILESNLIKNHAHPSFLISDFSTILNQNLENIIGRLSHHSLNLKESTTDINRTVLTIAAKTRDVTESSISISDKVSSVSLSTEQLSFAINEIAKQINKTAVISQKSKDQAKNAENIVNDLKKAVSRIDEVVLLISEIANQTNLLALNATIESARSGNAGKGFAVVASEVKKLATQTSLATEEIKQKIREIQNHTDHVVGAIDDMNTTVHDINHTTTVVSFSIEEQSATTQDLFKTISDLSVSLQSVVQNLLVIRDQSNTAEEDISKISTMAQHIEANTTAVNNVVRKFMEFEEGE